MKAKELREQSVEELSQTRDATVRDVFDLRVKKISGDTSGQPLRVRMARRDVARVKTVMKEREKEQKD